MTGRRLASGSWSGRRIAGSFAAGSSNTVAARVPLCGRYRVGDDLSAAADLPRRVGTGVHDALAGAGWDCLSGRGPRRRRGAGWGADQAIGADFRFSAGLVGLLVALGADGPEVTSALISVVSGSGEVGLGVVMGSNVYNLAGLLGLSAVLAGGLATGRRTVAPDAGTAALLTAFLAGLVLITAWHVALAAIMLLVAADMRLTKPPSRSGIEASGLAAARTMPRALAMRLHLPAGTSRSRWGAPCSSSWAARGWCRVLCTWALDSACRPASWARWCWRWRPACPTPGQPSHWYVAAWRPRPFPRPLIAIPQCRDRGRRAGSLRASVFLRPRTVDIGWLVGMTVVTVALVSFRRRFARAEGALLLAIYGAFLVVRLVAFG